MIPRISEIQKPHIFLWYLDFETVNELMAMERSKPKCGPFRQTKWNRTNLKQHRRSWKTSSFQHFRETFLNYPVRGPKTQFLKRSKKNEVSMVKIYSILNQRQINIQGKWRTNDQAVTFDCQSQYFVFRENKKCPWKPILMFIRIFSRVEKFFHAHIFPFFSRPLFFSLALFWVFLSTFRGIWCLIFHG